MGRTAAPAMPGTDPATSTATDKTDADALARDTLQAGALAAAATSEAESAKVDAAALHALVTQQSAELAELRNMVKVLGRNQVAQAHPEKVELPELGSVMKQKPDVPVLTAGGWYVPPVLPNQRS